MRAFLFVLCIAAVAMGCKKDSQPNSPLFGKWELRIQRSGWQPDKNFAAGNGNILQFNADSTYKFYVGGAVTKQGTFHIAKPAYAQTPENINLIYYDKSTDGELIDVQNDKLTLGSSAADGPSYVYAKK